MLPYSAVNLPIQPLMEHSFMALVGAAAMIVVAALLVVWTVVFYQSALADAAKRIYATYLLLTVSG